MKTHHHFTVPCALLLIALCLFIRYTIGRRRFERRGVAGLQRFSTYNRFVWVTAFERLLIMIANACGWTGAVLLAITGFDHLKF